MRPEPTPPAGAGVRDLGKRAACFRIQDVDHSATNLHVQLEGEPDSRGITRHCNLRVSQYIPLRRIGKESDSGAYNFCVRRRPDSVKLHGGWWTFWISDASLGFGVSSWEGHRFGSQRRQTLN